METTEETVRIVLTNVSMSGLTPPCIHLPVDFSKSGEELIEEIERQVVQDPVVQSVVRSGCRYTIETSCLASKQEAVRAAWRNGFGESVNPHLVCRKVVLIDHCEDARGSAPRSVHTGESHPVLNWSTDETLRSSAERELTARRAKFEALKDSKVDLVCRIPHDASLAQVETLRQFYTELFGLSPRLDYNYGFSIVRASVES